MTIDLEELREVLNKFQVGVIAKACSKIILEDSRENKELEMSDVDLLKKILDDFFKKHPDYQPDITACFIIHTVTQSLIAD